MGHDSHNQHTGHSPKLFRRKFWVCLVLTLPVLLFSPAVQGWIGVDIAFIGSQYVPVILGTIIFIYGGWPFIKGAGSELTNRTPGMMTLISLAIIVAFVYSLAVSISLVDGMDFWWELATLVTVMLLGHWLETAAVTNAQGALRELAKLLPDTVELVGADTTHKIPISDLKAGDQILIRPGGQIPADGQVASGDSSVNESLITGESKPVKKTAASQVIAGTINGNGALTVRVAKVGQDTALAGIMKLVAEAQNSKSKAQDLANKAAFYLTIIAVGTAILTAIVWSMAGASSGFILERSVTVLVTACPHALGLAIPLVIAISTTLAAKNGLLIRQRMALETARNVDIVLFDKTGTLTQGQQGVANIWPAGSFNKDDILGLTASLEQPSEHNIGKAIYQHALQKNLTFKKVQNFNALPGQGVEGIIGRKRYAAVSRGFLEQNNISIPKTILLQVNQAAAGGQTEVYLIEKNTVIGALALGDQIRKESRQAVAALKTMGIKTAMITGDSKDVAAYVARELGVDHYFAEIQPKDKAAKVKELQSAGQRVAMVGDGVNDAPALVQADVGVAIGAGTDVAIESAGIILTGSNPQGVVNAIRLSRATYAKMLQNLGWATGYNLIALPLAAGVGAAAGFIPSPALGAILMSLSTIIVTVNAQLLRGNRL